MNAHKSRSATPPRPGIKGNGARLGALLALALGCALAWAPGAFAAVFKYEAALSERLSSSLPSGFEKPKGVAFNKAGELFVGGQVSGSGVVERFDAGGAFATQLGAGSLGEHVAGVAVGDESGHVHVSEAVPARLTVLGASGEGLSVWEGLNTPAKTFAGGEGRNFLYDAVDNSNGGSRGDIYVMNLHEGGEVDVFKPKNGDKEEGEYLRRLESPEGFSFEPEDGLAVDDSTGAEAGDVYVVDSGHKVVDRFSASGTFEEAHQLKGFIEPTAVGVDSTTGDVFVVDHVSFSSFVVEAFSASGESLGQITGVNGKPFGSSSAPEPLSLGVSPGGETAGDVYIADLEKNKIDVFAEEKPGAPNVLGPSTTDVSADSANLVAEIGPQGLPSEYRFEYGPCTTMFTCSTSPYVSSVSSPEGAVGATEDYGLHTVSAHIQGLSSASTYHFRVVASNA